MTSSVSKPASVTDGLHVAEGHFAGGPGTNPKDVDFIDAKLKQLLAG